jgi:hypothetical protein
MKVLFRLLLTALAVACMALLICSISLYTANQKNAAYMTSKAKGLVLHYSTSVLSTDTLIDDAVSSNSITVGKLNDLCYDYYNQSSDIQALIDIYNAAIPVSRFLPNSSMGMMLTCSTDINSQFLHHIPDRWNLDAANQNDTISLNDDQLQSINQIKIYNDRLADIVRKYTSTDTYGSVILKKNVDTKKLHAFTADVEKYCESTGWNGALQENL